MFIGLPGGSNSEGPATTAGCLFVSVCTVVAFALLFAMLWYTANLISIGS